MLTNLGIVNNTYRQAAVQICVQVRYQLYTQVFEKIEYEIWGSVWNQVIVPLKEAKKEKLGAYSP